MENNELWRLLLVMGFVLIVGFLGAVLIASLPTGASEKAKKRELELKRKLLKRAANQSEDTTVEDLRRLLEEERAARIAAETKAGMRNE